ncbi:MAG: sulfatase [Mucilaginibacter polytrichastri]|nr:sulfatase [Mucilaginibacter polytrichastri]
MTIQENTGRKRLAILLFSLCWLPLLSLAQKPNIVIIMADDLDSRQLSCYGGQNIRTTNIDALAAEGLQFNRIYASEAMCVPTRASLFTGLYPVRNGAYQNHKPVRPGLKSVAHYLGAQGYRVGLSGKDHVTKPKSIFPFEIIAGFEPNCVAATDDYQLDSIRRFIQQPEPYCLFIMSINPHAPWTVGDPSEFDAKKLVLPGHWVDTDSTRARFTHYLAEVRRLDNQVGDVMKMLRETGQDKNTIVIFLGEQGPQFPGGKWTCWDNGQKSSMIVRYPEKAQSGSKTDAMVQYEDITPTLLDIAGGKPVPGLDGKSFLPVILGKSARHRDFAYGIHNNIPEGPRYPMRSVRDGRYKLIVNLEPEREYRIKFMMNPGSDNPTWRTWQEKAKTDPVAKSRVERIAHHPPLEFYDTDADPYELKNLAKDPKYAAKIRQLRTQLDAWMKQQNDPGASLDIPLKQH